ncbi:hypothetical protein ACWEKT_19250 [Nocardia takedensis]
MSDEVNNTEDTTGSTPAAAGSDAVESAASATESSASVAAASDATAEKTTATGASAADAVVDTAKVDTAVVDTAVVDTAVVDTAKVDTAKTETAKTETAKVEAAKAETAAAIPVATGTAAAEAVPAAASAEAPEASGGRLSRLKSSGKGSIAVRAAAVLVVGASVAAAVFFFLQDRDSQAKLDAQEQARAAACAYAPVLAEYDSKNLDTYFQAVLAGATGDWKKQFDDTSKELREVLTQGEVVSKANDVQCAIKSGDENAAEAIVVIGQTITSLGTQGKPAPGQLSMVMRLENTDGKWLVNKVNSPLMPSGAQ